VRGVGPGTVLGGRYTVHRRLEQLHGVERWSADDATLGRSVSILCIPAEDHRTPVMLDAARRAASVTHVVFVRILDVGTDRDVAYVVEEDLADARTLVSLVIDGGVPGDEVRRITGEVASALESARQRGMHHLDLTPDDVLRTSDGDIRLRGLETAAVRAGEDGAEAEEAARRDAVGVVALAYAGLTGLWPLGAGGAGLGAAPRVPGGVAAPSEIAAGVPRDLDAICRLTLNDDQGPTSPGDYARQVAPWPSRQVVGRPVTPTTRAAAPPVVAAWLPETIEQPASDRTAAHPIWTGAEASGRAAEARHGAGGASSRAAAAAAGAAGLSSMRDRTASPDPLTTETDRMTQPTGDHGAPPSPVDVPGREATRVLPLPAESDWRQDPPRPDDAVVEPVHRGGWDDVRRDEHPGRGEPAGQIGTADDAAPRSRRNGAAAAGAGAAGAAVAGAFSGVGERVGGLARRAVDKVSELSPDSAAGGGGSGLEYPAPMVPAEPLTKDESRLALGIVAGFLILALVIGIWGVSRIGRNSDFSLGGPPTRAASAQPSPSVPSASPSAGGTAGSPEPLAILKVEAHDPQGDGEENNRLTPTIYDGDRKTGWVSENYRSDKFGGLKKGLGVIVDLGPNKKPQTVELVMPQQADVEVHIGPDNRLEGATRIGEKKDAEGTVKFDVPADVSGQYVVVWFTELTEDDNGKRRARLNEVVVTG
jgi:eukaryotic-like serine/threonine-protein kinase